MFKPSNLFILTTIVFICCLTTINCATTAEIKSFFEAVRAGDVKKVEQLIADGISVDVVGEGGDTALHIAVEIGDKYII